MKEENHKNRSRSLRILIKIKPTIKPNYNKPKLRLSRSLQLRKMIKKNVTVITCF